MNSTAPPLRFSFSSLPDEIITNCLARVSKSQYSSLSTVSKKFHSLLSSPEIHAARSEIGATEPRLYLCCESLRTTTRCYSWYNLRNLRNCDEIKLKSNLRLVPVGLTGRLQQARLAVGYEIYQFGGITNKKSKRVRSVCVLDCRSQTQRRAPKMRVARKSARACVLDGSIYVMGGCRERECWGEVFDLKTQTWKKEILPIPSVGDDEFKFDREFEVLVLGSRIYVITKGNKYAYDRKEGRWLLLDTRFAGLQSILELGTVWCVLDNLVFKEFSDELYWYDLSCGEWLMVEGLADLLWDAKVKCSFRMIQLVNYGGKLMIIYMSRVVRKETTWFAVIRLEKRLTSSQLAIWGEIEQLDYLVRWSFNPLTCLSVSL
ncbi:hypothetical protein Bca52824_094366 [Brassica carinata]|uniref:F-box domain-containing protein n=1 Tax=Brassica carinata TaxID=52824 RepID=A0A8X7TKU8_BRACI|nr:hypothetical protein Bca52824_094366 [Brassica carinata]